MTSRHRSSGTGAGSGGGSSSGKNAHVGRIVTINLSDHPPKTPLGVLLAPACPTYTTTPQESTLTILAGWERLPSEQGGGLGPIQRTGQVRLGDRLVKINNVDVTGRSFRQVMDMLKSMVHGHDSGSTTNKKDTSYNPGNKNNTKNKKPPKLKSLSFEVVPAAGPASLRQEQRRMRQQQHQEQNGSGHNDELLSSSGLFDKSSSSPPRGGWGNGNSGKLYSFSSTLRRARIHSSSENLEEDDEYVGNRNESNDDVGGTHIEYEIVCRLSIRSQEELVWSVWRRYLAFKLMDEKLRKAYGWQIDALNDGWGLRFPGGHAVYAWFVGNHDPSFVESRRAELESYWQSLQRVEDAFDLNPGSQKYSRIMAEFLDADRYLPRCRSHPNMSGGASVMSGGLSLGFGGGFGSGMDSPLRIREGIDEDDGEDLPRHNNELLNIVLSGSSALDTSVLSTYSTPPGTGKKKRKKRIPGATKSALQRSPMNDF